MVQLGGVLPVISTPFTVDGAIDLEVLHREIAWLLDSGADGVTVAMVSEILRLDTAERMQLGEHVIAATAGRGSVVLSVGSESTAQSLRLVEHAVGAGATALMANPPLTSSPDAAEMLDYFRQLATESDRLPLVIQDASGYVGRPIPLDVLITLLDEYGPDKVQFKPEAEPLGPRLTALRTATGGTARVFEGSGGRALVESHQRGVVGTMPGADLIGALVLLWRALESDDADRALSLQESIVPLLNLVSSLDSYVAVEKHLLRRQGVFPDARQRGPVDFAFDPTTHAEVDRLFDRLQAKVQGFHQEARTQGASVIASSAY